MNKENLIRFYRKFDCACGQVKIRGFDIATELQHSQFFFTRVAHRTLINIKNIEQGTSIHPLLIMMDKRISKSKNIWNDSSAIFGLEYTSMNCGLYYGFSQNPCHTMMNDKGLNEVGNECIESFRLARYMLNKYFKIKLNNGKSLFE